MPDGDPSAEHPFGPDPRPQLSWPATWERLAAAGTYWLSTSRADGWPHAVPLLAVMGHNMIYFAANPGSRKARNLAGNPHCVLSTTTDRLDLAVEGTAVRVRDAATLAHAAAAYAAKYDWHVTIADDAFAAAGAPTAGAPPYALFALMPRLVFAFGTDETANATRWRFLAAN